MINLDEITPDFTGTWFQGKVSGDYKVYILEKLGNDFFAIITDKNGIAEAEGLLIASNQTQIVKVYARYVVNKTNASPFPIFYIFPVNIFDLSINEEIKGEWKIPNLSLSGSTVIKSLKK